MSLRKLTLSVDEGVIEGARRYSQRHRTSISKLVSSYLEALARSESAVPLSPTVRRLMGVLPPDAGREDYRSYLRGKHGQ